jgi:hypothetical protein
MPTGLDILVTALYARIDDALKTDPALVGGIPRWRSPRSFPTPS